MTDAELHDPRPGQPCAGDELRADHGAVGGQGKPAGEVAPDELEGAVDVADVEVEHAPDEPVPRVRVGSPHQRVHPHEAVADDQVVVPRRLHEVLELGEVELEVGVGQQDPVAAGRGDPGSQRRAVSAVLVVDEHADARVAGGGALGDRARRVGAAVVDDQDLVVSRRRGRRGGGFADGRGNVLLLVVAREDDGEARQAIVEHAGKRRRRR
jgi:hypothetical protein